jgi:hypothetical protein
VETSDAPLFDGHVLVRVAVREPRRGRPAHASGGIGIEADGGTTHPAAWNDWLACVCSVVDGAEDEPVSDTGGGAVRDTPMGRAETSPPQSMVKVHQMRR